MARTDSGAQCISNPTELGDAADRAFDERAAGVVSPVTRYVKFACWVNS
jgi:hypothetical protein